LLQLESHASQVFADRFSHKTLLIPVGGSSLAYRWWMYPPLHTSHEPPPQQLEFEKQRHHSRTKLISAISSTKNETLGHAFRLEAVKYLEQQRHVQVDVYGWGRRPSRDIGDYNDDNGDNDGDYDVVPVNAHLGNIFFRHQHLHDHSFGFFFSGEAICSYMFTIVIENSFEPLYCTEKLINALLCGTVPIYR